jgi:hypothetical protein
MSRVTQTPAGWFPDPQLPGQLRYWDGAAWTAHTQPGGVGEAQPNAEGAVASLVLGILSTRPAAASVAGAWRRPASGPVSSARSSACWA